ncbi:hypothetical protein SBV42_05230 [Chlamydia crocodili]|uniref:Transmembrane protein n=1 Tax=Chlamydia crocodili TaxID=2766982 RepID=A0ABX8CDQ4_9CHLA|nr:hypothetical protein [Chlamydia crocodili]QVE49145.1 hypothetical protein H9Q19_00275 [Chlamydia crocodili]
MSCKQVMSDIRDGLGFNGFSSRHLVKQKLSVNITRVIMTLVTLLLGFGALICGIGTCTSASFMAMSLAGGAAIALGLVMLMLACYWSYGVFASFQARKAPLPGTIQHV